MNQLPPAFWSIAAADLLKILESVKEGLTGSEAKKRLDELMAKIVEM